jgi:hypothetical protein
MSKLPICGFSYNGKEYIFEVKKRALEYSILP